MSDRDRPARRLAQALRRWRPRPASVDPPLALEPPPEQTLEAWRRSIEERLAALEDRHDASVRRQTVLIILALLGEIALEIIKRNT